MPIDVGPISDGAFLYGLRWPQMIECAASAALDLDIVGDSALSSLE
ncbi:hypothetical protein SAMN06265374_0826 [Roseibium denhamense]|uniref:Uncharacterized protein n=1 Tax=Roseibium denhamense TaxID=76305 RepID=A0ABY1NEE7_9HYPH|nr:hypothetical protein [Roseibium denhamense]SMP07078.1 hypothetical protein SAMN06265374_0826 [Roseibium denhamense]